MTLNPDIIGAIASEKETVEQLGSELEKKEKTSSYYYRIVEEARKMSYNEKNKDGHWL